jgi:hypothetical protein
MHGQGPTIGYYSVATSSLNMRVDVCYLGEEQIIV